MKMIHMSIPGHEEATLEGYILDCELTLGQETNRPAIVICPGGGYLYCSPGRQNLLLCATPPRVSMPSFSAILPAGMLPVLHPCRESPGSSVT